MWKRAENAMRDERVHAEDTCSEELDVTDVGSSRGANYRPIRFISRRVRSFARKDRGDTGAVPYGRGKGQAVQHTSSDGRLREITRDSLFPAIEDYSVPCEIALSLPAARLRLHRDAADVALLAAVAPTGTG